MDLNFNTYDDPEWQARHTEETVRQSQIVSTARFLNRNTIQGQELKKTNTQQLLQQLTQILHLIQEAQNDETEPQMLVMDNAVRNKLADILGIPTDTSKIADKDNDNQLSVGNLIKASQVSTSSHIVSAGNINVGISLTGKLIPNDKIVDINRQQYSIGFLKLQVADYANSTYADPPDSAISLTYSDHSWGYPNGYNYYAYRFESYISNTFPLGEPSLLVSPQAE